MLVRDARPADAPAIAAIYAHYVRGSVATFETDPPTAQDWLDKRAELQSQAMPLLVGEDGGVVIGFGYLSRWRAKPAYRHTVEDTVYLDPAHIGRGHGRALLAEVLRRASACGARQVIAVIADTGDGASQALHRSAGFTDAGRLRAVGYKHGRWIDTILMQRTLTATSDQALRRALP